MYKLLKAGEYHTQRGKYHTEKDLTPLTETKTETYYYLKDENGAYSVVPLSHIKEETGYSTGYSSDSSSSNNTGTDTTGGRAKKIKKKKKPTVNRRGKKND